MFHADTLKEPPRKTFDEHFVKCRIPIYLPLSKMTFAELIKSNAWLSVKMVLIKLFADQEDFMDDYQNVFNKLQVISPLPSNITIDIESVHDTYDNSQYVDVAGYYTNPANRNDEYTNSLAIEYTPWNEWLGMPIDENSLKIFSELEIISHCLNEMTYAGFEQEDIQSEMDKMRAIKEEYNNLTTEEKKKRTIPLEDLEPKCDIDFDKIMEGNRYNKKNN